MERYFTLPKKLLLSLCVFLWSCDYGFNYEYVIKNATSGTIVVETNPRRNPDDTTHPVQPAKSYVVVTDGGLCGKNFLPPDKYTDEQSVIPTGEKVEIYVKTGLQPDYAALSGDFKLRKYWTYDSKNRSGRYTLVLTDELLDELGLTEN